MRKLIVSLALLMAALATTGSAHAEFSWQHYGVDPFATSREEAMAARPRAFQGLGLSNSCMQAAYQAMSSSGRIERLNNGDRLAAMMSSGYRVNRDVVVAFVQPARGIDTSAVVETWEFDCDGTRVKIGLPQVCNNWVLYPISQPIRQAQAAPVGNCPGGYVIAFNAWNLSDLATQHPDLYARAVQLVAQTRARDSRQANDPQAYQGPDFSRTLGHHLRTEVRNRYPINTQVEVNYRDPRSTKVTARLGMMTVFAGEGEMRLPDDPRGHIVELILPDDFVTEGMSGGHPRIWDLPNEWPKCKQYVHAGLIR